LAALARNAKFRDGFPLAPPYLGTTMRRCQILENRILGRAPKRIPPVGSLGACRGAEKRVTPFRGSFLQFIVSIHISGMIDRWGLGGSGGGANKFLFLAFSTI
jgi:hypothetical protein